MVSKAICWRGLIFEASCAYSKISPLPDLGHVYCRKRGGGAYFRDNTVLVPSCARVITVCSSSVLSKVAVVLLVVPESSTTGEIEAGLCPKISNSIKFTHFPPPTSFSIVTFSMYS